MNRLKEIEEEIRRYEKILLVSHMSPEGDAIGSQLGLSRALRHRGKKTISINQDGLPRNLKFLKGSKSILKPKEIRGKLDQFNLCIALDCGSLDRLGSELIDIIEEKYLINIDHHEDNTKFGDLNYVEDRSSTSEIILKLLKHTGLNIDPPLATILYTGIIADTDSFRNDNVTSETLSAASELIDLGGDSRKVSVNLYENNPFPKLKLLGRVLGRSKFKGGIVWSMIPRKLLEKTDTEMEDTEGIITKLRSTGGAKVAFLLKEIGENKVKASLRAKADIDVSEIARKFGGGGHQKAAGCLLEGDLKQAEEKVLNKLKEKIENE